MATQKNVLLYGGIAIIVVVAVFIAIVVTFQPSGPLHINVSIRALNYNPKATYLFNTTKFNITIKNTGSSSIKDMPVSFYLNDQALKDYNVSIPAHSSVNINENYTYSQNGTYNFSVAANPSGILNVANNSISYASISVNVSNPQSPNLYPYIPSNGTTSTYTFTLFPRGMEFSSLLSISYNVSSFKPFMGPDKGLVFTIMHDLSQSLNVGNGVFSQYSNGSSAYGIWLEGVIGNSYIKSILSTYSFKQSSFTIRNSTALFAKVNDTTSMCSYSSQGWTKIYFYYNATHAGNCQSVLGKTYNSTEYKLIENATSLHASEYAKIENFSYSNSTDEGFAVGLSNGNYSAYQISENPSSGNFGSIFTFHAPINVSSANYTCPAYIYVNNSTGMNMCTTYYKSPASEFDNYSLSRSIAISKNYTMKLYSFVDANYSNLALFNAASLFTKLNVSDSYVSWKPIITSSCTFDNTSFGCSYDSFNSTSKMYTISIKNKLNTAVKVSDIGCSLYLPVNATVPINMSIAPNSSINASFTCKLPPVAIGATIPTYYTTMNYSINGKPAYVNGSIEYANFFVS